MNKTTIGNKSSAGFAWRPTEETIQRARLSAFITQCGVDNYAALQRRSAEDVAWFTNQLLQFLDIRFSPAYQNVLDLSQGLPWAKWCVGGGLNIAERCLDYHRDSLTFEAPAVIWEGEEGTCRTLTYRELHRQTEHCAAGLRAIGLKNGDTIALHLPMVPETVISLLAIARIGAIAVPVFSGYGPEAIQTRLNDVEAKCLFTCDGFLRRGKTIPAKHTAQQAMQQCPSIRHLIVVARDERVYSAGEPTGNEPEERTWQALLEAGKDLIQRNGADVGMAAPTSAEDALLVLYTSGTTGNPKGIVHSHCGFPLKAAQDMTLGTDVGNGTRISWVTDIGWMMGPWLIYGALILGATMVLYDGAPDYPAPDRLWEFCAKHQVEVLGISPSLIRALAPHGIELPCLHDMSALRILASTGESWDPQSWQWLFENVGKLKLPIINYSGGTEISGGILMGNPLLPQKPCSFSAPCPGMDIDVLDADGNSIQSGIGELVIRQPWIGMARGFWRAPERYLETYWSRWPDIWLHGDWASRDEEGQWFIHGRSDDTIKVAGKRIGPAELESVLIAHPIVQEAAAIDVPDALKGSQIAVFCVLAHGTQGDEVLAGELREAIGLSLGKPLRPQDVFFVPSLPKTKNSKTMRRLIRAVYLGDDPGDLSALDNPAALEFIGCLSQDRKKSLERLLHDKPCP
jgi:acetyl-CoA synthetase